MGGENEEVFGKLTRKQIILSSIGTILGLVGLYKGASAYEQQSNQADVKAFEEELAKAEEDDRLNMNQLYYEPKVAHNIKIIRNSDDKNDDVALRPQLSADRNDGANNPKDYIPVGTKITKGLIVIGEPADKDRKINIWYKVEYHGKVGYVFGGYTELESTPEEVSK